MKVYLVTEGEYSDYSVLGVYSTEEKAEEAQNLYAASNGLEEFELDFLPPHPPGEFRWCVRMKDNGDLGSVYQVPPGDSYVPFESSRALFHGMYPKTDGRSMYIWARDAEHAVKIASEKRRQMLVSGEWHKDDLLKR